MTVIYYTSTFFLDISLDVISTLKQHVDLHVFIEVTPSSKNVTVAGIGDFPPGKQLTTPAEIMTAEGLKALQPYFTGTASTHFVIHNHRSGFSLSTLRASLAVWKYVKPFKPQIIHFEGYTLRTIGMLPFLFSVKKVFMAIHDPVTHSGEGSWKISLPNFLFFYLPFKKRFLFYSEFARNLFINNYKKVTAPKLLIKMCPFSYYKQSPGTVPANETYLLFFGRISPYKGVAVLLDAMPAVLEAFPNQQLIIAGKNTNGYVLNNTLAEKYKSNISFINRYIPDNELITLISKAKIVICPYLDATQSGVLMTAYALNTPVIATNVGSFPEFIEHGFNGLIVPPANPVKLAEAIIEALSNDYYKTLKNNIASSPNTWEQSLTVLLKEYAA